MSQPVSHRLIVEQAGAPRSRRRGPHDRYLAFMRVWPPSIRFLTDLVVGSLMRLAVLLVGVWIIGLLGWAPASTSRLMLFVVGYTIAFAVVQLWRDHRARSSRS